MKQTVKQFWRICIVLILLIGLSPLPKYQALAQETTEPVDPYGSQVAALMEQMDVRDRVGQLFLATFTNDSAATDTLIADLIQNYNLGGVVYLAANNNITDENDPPTQVANLSNEIQTRAYEVSAQGDASVISITQQTSPFIPLFVGIDHEGDGYPYTRIMSGVTEIPNNMAIGATWKTNDAEKVGRIVGSELGALGINMLLGPSLDVLENPIPDSPGGLGTRTFGGDPYWVGLMGQAYIRGIHVGSEGRMAVISKHFPGHGGSDRQPDQEVSTVRKSLEQLKQIELAPFFAVTGNSPGMEETTDGLMTSHIRYQGFQGNIRESTRPISFDPQALDTIMELPEFASWRSAGGLIVSDALGVHAVKRFYDPQFLEFPHRQIALDAFLAGNDILLLSEFALTADFESQAANIKDTIEYFYDMYNTDIAFQERVNRSVERVLRLKLELYGGNLDIQNVLVDTGKIKDVVGKSRDDIVLLAQDAITLISPGLEELADRLPSPPNKNDKIVFFTDLRMARQCSRCDQQAYIDVSDLQNTVLKLYGPNGTNQVVPGNLTSFSFQELETFLEPPAIQPEPPTPTPESESTETTPEPTATPSPPAIETALDNADWIIFAMLNVTTDQLQSNAVKAFLAERPDIASKAKVIVLAFNAPYYLDTTNISKLTAYYGLYSKIEAFVDIAAKAIFQQIKPRGASPVTILGTGYDLIVATSPDPNQIIQLSYSPETMETAGVAEPSTTPIGPADLRVGNSLNLQTGVIIDHNGNPVPDGTPVQFTISYLSEGLGFDVPQPEVPTKNGIARIEIMLDRPGQLQIKASSGEARASVGLAVTVFEDQPPIIEEIAPTPTNTPTPVTPSPTSTPTELPPTPTPTYTSTPTATPTRIIVPYLPHEKRTDFNKLSVAIIGILFVSSLGFFIGRVSGQADLVKSARLSLIILIGGMVGYNYYALALPGSKQLESWLGYWSATVITWLAGILMLIVGSLYLNRHINTKN